MKLTKRERLEFENKKLSLEIKSLQLDNFFKLIKIFLTVILGLTATIKLIQLSELFIDTIAGR